MYLWNRVKAYFVRRFVHRSIGRFITVKPALSNLQSEHMSSVVCNNEAHDSDDPDILDLGYRNVPGFGSEVAIQGSCRSWFPQGLEGQRKHFDLSQGDEGNYKRTREGMLMISQAATSFASRTCDAIEQCKSAPCKCRSWQWKTFSMILHLNSSD